MAGILSGIVGALTAPITAIVEATKGPARRSNFEEEQMRYNELTAEKYRDLNNDYQQHKREQSQINGVLVNRISDLDGDYRGFRRDQEAFNRQAVEEYRNFRDDYDLYKRDQNFHNNRITNRVDNLETDYLGFRNSQEAFNKNAMKLFGDFQQQYQTAWSEQTNFNELTTGRLDSLDQRTNVLEGAHIKLREEFSYVTSRAEKHYDMSRAHNEQTDRHLRTLDGTNVELWKQLEEQKKLFTMVGLAVVLIAGYLYKKHVG